MAPPGITRVGATTQVIENLLAGFLARYRRSNPGIEVHLIEDGGARLPKRLDQGEVQLAIMPAGDDFPGRLLYPMYLIAIAQRVFRLNNAGCLEITELADQPVLLLSREFASRGWFEAACQMAHIKPRALLESTAPQTLVALARADHGVAVVPSPVAIQKDGVHAAPLVYRGAPIGRWTTIAWRAQRFLPAYAERFVGRSPPKCDAIILAANLFVMRRVSRSPRSLQSERVRIVEPLRALLSCPASRFFLYSRTRAPRCPYNRTLCPCSFQRSSLRNLCESPLTPFVWNGSEAKSARCPR